MAIVMNTGLFVACNNEEDVKQMPMEKVKTQEEVFNKDNPYDVYGEQLMKLFRSIGRIIVDNEKLDEEDYQKHVDYLLKNTIISYPVLSEKDIMQLDSTYFSQILHEFTDNLLNKGLVKASRIAEKRVIGDIHDLNEQKKLSLYNF
ncbi:MAG: hypothetical protein Q4Q06_04220 [Bacteroidota bacterium]|nr:hypothetical protein [Bacteroidota bacterium]